MTEQQWIVKRGDFAAVGAARRSFLDYLQRLASDDSDLAAAELIFGELMMNAARHARDVARAELVLSEAPKLRVSEDGDQPWRGEIEPADTDATSGRGMYIVKSLAVHLEIEPAQPGRVVSAVLPVQIRDAPANSERFRAASESGG